jgi:hypothetical protein
MHKLLEKISKILEDEISLANLERAKNSEPRIKPIKITILGQFALIINQGISEKIPLAATMDVDALFEGDWSFRKIFERTLKDSGLILDELSSEIWIPPQSQYVCYYKSAQITIQGLTPIYCLLSKAIKAPDKNKVLIINALEIYGTELSDLIKKFNGDLNFFKL